MSRRTKQGKPTGSSENNQPSFSYQSIFSYSNASNHLELQTRQDQGSILSQNSLFRFLIIVFSFLTFILLFPILAWKNVKKVSLNERLVVYRLGQLLDTRGPGYTTTLPFIDEAHTVLVNNATVNVDSVSGKTNDDGIVDISCITITYHVFDPILSITTVCDLQDSIRNLISTSVLQQIKRFDTDLIESAKFDISTGVKHNLNDNVHKWGVCITYVTIETIKIIHSPPSITPMSLLSNIDFNSVGQHFNNFLSVNPSPNTLQTSSRRNSPVIDAVKLFFQQLETIKAMCIGEDSEEAELAEFDQHVLMEESNVEMNKLTEKTWKTLIISFIQIINDSFKKASENSQMQSDLGFHVYQFDVFHKLNSRREEMQFFIDAKQGFAHIGTSTEPPDVTISISRNDLASLIQGKISAVRGVLTGRIVIDGDYNVAMKLKAIQDHIQLPLDFLIDE